MKHSIQKFKIETELDVVLAYRSAMQLSEVCGLKIAAQTKFSTAVSEICRNVIEHVGLGAIELGLHEENGQFCLEAYITDNGRGIQGLEEFLNRKFATSQLKGNGIFNSRRLADEFRIESEVNMGTKVWLRKRLSPNHPPINKAIISGWKEHFSKEVVISPYAELKRQNQQLIELLDQLRLRNLEVEHQIDEIQRLNLELENANSEVTDLLTQREESNVRLQQANRELDAFAYTVSHDLKAPLRNIEGLSSAIFESLKVDDRDDALHCIKLIIEQAKRMDGLIGGILDSARTGLLKLEKKNLSLTPFIKNLTSNFTVPNGFLVQVQPNMPHIQTEELLLAQVLMNLLNNAIKHHDQPEGKVNVRCEKKDDLLQFTVQDDGPGIAAEHQNLIFHPFGSIAPGKTVDSTGLGLSIVKRIVESKGGRIWLESEGRGASFFFTWPAEEAADENAEAITKTTAKA